MSGKEGGNFDSIKRIHKAGERVLGKSQGAHGLGVMGISSHEGFSERAEQDGPIHILGPSPDRSRAVGAAPAPGIGH